MMTRELLQKIVDAQVRARELRAHGADGATAVLTAAELAGIAAVLEALSDATMDLATTPPPDDPRTYERKRKRAYRDRQQVDDAPAEQSAHAREPAAHPVPESVRDSVRDTITNDPPPLPPPTPPTNTPTRVLLDACCSASERDGTAATDPPPTAASRASATPSTDPPIAGVVVGEVHQWAIQLTVAANQGIAAAIGEQPVPIRADMQLDAAEVIMATGVELELARSVVRAEAERATARRCGAPSQRKRGGKPPRSLAYFADAVRDAWAAEQERRRARETPEPIPAPSREGPSSGQWPGAGGGMRRGGRPAPGEAGQQAYDIALQVAQSISGGTVASGGSRP